MVTASTYTPPQPFTFSPRIHIRPPMLNAQSRGRCGLCVPSVDVSSISGRFRQDSLPDSPPTVYLHPQLISSSEHKVCLMCPDASCFHAVSYLCLCPVSCPYAGFQLLLSLFSITVTWPFQRHAARANTSMLLRVF